MGTGHSNSSPLLGAGGMQCASGCGFRLFEVRFAVLVPVECGLRRSLRFLNVCMSRFSLNFGAVGGFRRKILFLVKNLQYLFD